MCSVSSHNHDSIYPGGLPCSVRRASKVSESATMGSDSLELASSTQRTFQDNAPLANLQGSGSFLPLQPLEPSTGKDKAKVSIHDSKCLIFPSPSQQAAATILQDFDDAKIFNCLSVLRSLSPNYQQSSHSEGLSTEQLIALSTLKDYQNEDVFACLEASRRGKR